MSTNKKALIFGFAIGAAIVIATIYFFYPRTPAPEPIAVTASSELPPQHPPIDPQTNRPPSPHAFPADRDADAGKTLLSGTISLDPAITQSPGSPVTVFIIARTGPGKGKPVLARRIDAQSFPLTFQLTGADSMMAGEKPATVSLEARIDLDGDAMTREPGSPTARIASVNLGTASVALTLKPEA